MGTLLSSAGLHGWIDFIPIFILGLLLAWTYERTNNLTGCVIAHSMNNLLATVTILLR
ncbi:CPBP family intramembrane metalloprotease [Candidatus Poribacteria bacterium]|nr:CPBP family intramembrane metalloprotease [Candidatus Poribacteria bacterium]